MARKYVSPVVDFKRRRRSVAIPDQSLSIQEIVKRYVRGVPVDIVQRDGVYIDQSEDDLEKVSRMDFGEKIQYAAELKNRANALRNELTELERSQKEAKAKKAKDEADMADQKAQEAAEKAAAKRPQA